MPMAWFLKQELRVALTLLMAVLSVLLVHK